MRDRNVFAHTRALPRMSWSSHNLFNLWKRSTVEEENFERTSQSLFKQRWISKRLVRAYHGDHISEKLFKRWYLPSTLPDVRPRKAAIGDDSVALAKWANRDDVAEQIERGRQSQDKVALAPVGSLMFKEVERRIDVFIFRCCFAVSVYEARKLVVHKKVTLNGVRHTNPNTRLAPGDLVSVDPSAITFLRELGNTTESKQNSTENADGNIKESEQTTGQEKEQKTSGEDVAENKESTGESPKESEKGANPAAPGKKDKHLTPFTLPDYAAPFIFIPAYIEPSFSTCSAIYLRHPTARPGYSEIPTPYDADGEVVRLAWEWYAKRRPRMRSRSQLASMPEDNERKRAR